MNEHSGGAIDPQPAVRMAKSPSQLLPFVHVYTRTLINVQDF